MRRWARSPSDQKLFLAGNAYELDRHFPGLYFQTSFVIAPSGDVVLRYRRLNSMFAPTPHDVWSKYLDIYGLDGVFPGGSDGDRKPRRDRVGRNPLP
jgi:hypothetical protein